MEKQAIYLVFSGTPTKMGKFIRAVTNFEYNHVSVATDDSFRELYSFARYRKNAPFYAGFVCESKKRYFLNGRAARIRVYRIPLTEECYEKICAKLGSMAKNREKYIYNLPSALCVPIRRKVEAKNAYTCIEFAVQLVATYCTQLGLDDRDFWSIRRLQQYLAPYFLYEGEFKDAETAADWGEDGFMDTSSLIEDIRDSLAVVSKAVYRACRKGGNGAAFL